jgi:tetratricopeptide (TPR) repeat protein
MGKSRLLYECNRSLEGEGPGTHEVGAWLEGRCISYGRDISYFPIIHLLKDYFVVEETDGDAEITRKVETGVQALDADLASHLPYLKYLLAVDPGEASVATMDPPMRKTCLFEAVRALLITASALRPLVVTVEDLHWIDPLSEELLSSLVETVSVHPILLVLTSRPEYSQHFGSRPCVTTLDLQGLSERESAAVAQGLLGAGTMPSELQKLIHRKAAGNPFFIEEVTQSLLEVGALRRSGSASMLIRPIDEIYVPDTVQDVIMARLDRLPEEAKRALQIASVIGHEFTARLLERTAAIPGGIEEPLEELKAVELIYERALYPELAYMFKHALTRGVAYNSLLTARRKELHRVVGAAIEQLYSDRLAEQYEALAHHYEAAETWDQALDYLQKSADKALAACAPQQAIAFYDRALAAVEQSGQPLAPERAMALHFGRGQALFLTSDWDRSAGSFRAMLQTAQEAGDRVQEGIGLIYAAHAHFQGRRLEDALDYVERARCLAVRTNDPTALAGSLALLNMIPAATGDLQNARTAIEEALTAARQGGILLFEGLAFFWSGLLHHWRGDYTAALEPLDDAVRISRRHQVSVYLLASLWAKGMSHCGQGEYEQALRWLKEALELSGRAGDRFWGCRILNTLGWFYADLCHWDLAIQYDGESAAEARALGHPEIIRNAELNLADCYLALGQWDEAQRCLETVHQESQRRGGWGEEWMKWRYTQHMNASLAELWLARGDPEKALAFAGVCLASAEATDSRRNIAKGRRIKGEAFLARGQCGEAENEMEEALRVAQEVGNPAQLWKSLAALARLRQAQFRPHDAVAACQEAMAVVEGVAAGLSDPGLRDTLLASPQVAILRETAAMH